MHASEAKHRGFAFVTYGSAADAQDAIDNMDMNEMSGKVLKVNLARPMKGQLQAGGNRAGQFMDLTPHGAFISVLPHSLGVRGMVAAIREASLTKRWRTRTRC